MAKKKSPSIAGRVEKEYGGAIIVIIVLLLIGGVIYAILFGANPPSQSQSLLPQVQKALQAITAEHFTYNGTIMAAVGGEYNEIVFSGTGTTDLNSQRSEFTLELGERGDTAPLLLEVYRIGDTTYMKIGDDWTVMNVSDIAWDGPFSLNLFSIFSVVNNTELSFTTLDGRPAIKIRMVPTVAELYDLLKSSGAISSSLSPLNLSGADFGNNVKNMEVDLWVDKESLLPLHASFDMAFETTILNTEIGGVTQVEVSISAVADFDHQNIPAIVLPSDAKNLTQG